MFVSVCVCVGYWCGKIVSAIFLIMFLVEIDSNGDGGSVVVFGGNSFDGDGGEVNGGGSDDSHDDVVVVGGGNVVADGDGGCAMIAMERTMSNIESVHSFKIKN